jgi:hypothetical protein
MLMKSVILKAAVCLLLHMVMAPAAMAQATYTCTGVPRGVSMDNTGVLAVESLGGLSWAKFCSVESVQNGITVPACKALYAGLLVSQSSGRSATLWITNTAGSCAANTPWAMTPGLYFWRFDG